MKKAEEQAEAAGGTRERGQEVQGRARGSSLAAFKTKYGTNANKANAFGKCVSKLSKKATTG